MVPLHPDMYQYCGVHYQDPLSGEVVFWTWRVLFLGIKDAVYIFTHLLQPVVQYMRKVGWRGSLYIDDLDTLAPTFVECQYWRFWACLLYTSPSPRDQRGSRMPSSA